MLAAVVDCLEDQTERVIVADGIGAKHLLAEDDAVNVQRHREYGVRLAVAAANFYGGVRERIAILWCLGHLGADKDLAVFGMVLC